MGMNEHAGWLLDVYPDLAGGRTTVWFLADSGERLHLAHAFAVTFYAAGPPARLRLLWRFLSTQPLKVELSRTTRRDVFTPEPLTALAVKTLRAPDQPGLFYQAVQAFPDLDWFDADLHLLTRYAAEFDVFPLARCRVREEAGWIKEIMPLEERWELDVDPAPLRILRIEPDCDPFHDQPGTLEVRCDRFHARLPLEPARPLLANLASILRRYDPDLILTGWGDTWLLPYLLKLSEGRNDWLPLNRDPGMSAAHRQERTYFSYGQIIHRSEQTLLFGRFHIDYRGGMMFEEYGLEGVYELARLTGLPVQIVARNSPGAGITAMEVITALRRGILIPYRKQQAEAFKTAEDLIRLDQGGLVYQPLVGLHSAVAEVDFISMYPSIMCRFNISPENMPAERLAAETIEALEPRTREPQGLLPATLAPILEKRIAIKNRLAELDARDCRTKPLKARAAAMKWLLVVSFGYTGYKNAKFGRIEAHQAITAYAREILLTAKETAERLGFTVLHMYVDGLWVKKPGARAVADFQPLLVEIAKSTGLPIALDGVFNWIAFLPSRLDERVPVPNRYFGVFEGGEIKVRGIEARRHDTPRYVAETQMELLAIMAKARQAEELPMLLPEILALLKKRLEAIRNGRVEANRLIVQQKLSRDLAAYRVPSPSALAAAQLAAVHKQVGRGQSVRFLFVRGQGKVLAWDAAQEAGTFCLDPDRYTTLLIRAASAVLQPLGITEEALRLKLIGRAVRLLLPGFQAREIQSGEEGQYTGEICFP
jgi:DNA polymerase-2